MPAMYACDNCSTTIEDGYQNTCGVYGCSNGLCDSCIYSCEDCGIYLCEEDSRYSDSHEATLCESCYENSDEDYSVPLRIPPTHNAIPGQSILSTRAVGIEWEREGGNASAVIRDMRADLLEVKPEHCGTEFVSQPRRGADLERVILEMVDALSSAGFDNDQDCGTHFHVDLTGTSRDESWKAYVTLLHVEEIFAGLSGRTDRTMAQWCAPFAGASRYTLSELTARIVGEVYPTEGIRSAIPGTRYLAVNPHSYDIRQTIEIRALAGNVQTREECWRLVGAIAVATGALDFALSATPEIIGEWFALPSAVERVQSLADAGYIGDDIVTRILDMCGDDIAERAIVRRSREEIESVNAAYALRLDAIRLESQIAIADVRSAMDDARRWANVDRTALVAAQNTYARISADVAAMRQSLYALEEAQTLAYRAQALAEDQVASALAIATEPTRLQADALLDAVADVQSAEQALALHERDAALAAIALRQARERAAL